MISDIVNGFAHIHHNWRCDGGDIIPQVTVNSLHECMSLCGVDCLAVVFKWAEKSCATKFSCSLGPREEGADIYKKSKSEIVSVSLDKGKYELFKDYLMRQMVFIDIN